jgi:hypothetical protein
MQRHLTLLAHVHSLVVLVAVQGALLAVAAPGLATSIQLGAGDPVAETIESIERNYQVPT